jgi:hypothetical protein
VSLLPAPLDDETGLTARQLTRARRAQTSVELRLFDHALEARLLAEKDRIDSQVLADASRAALDEELDLLDYGLARAGRSAAAVELVARHVERVEMINDRRTTRRFGV